VLALPKSTQHNQGGISRISGRTPRGRDLGPPTVLELRAEDQDRGVEQTVTKVRNLDGVVVVVVGGGNAGPLDPPPDAIWGQLLAEKKSGEHPSPTLRIESL
jgi:hypothetical protein